MYLCYLNNYKYNLNYIIFFINPCELHVWLSRVLILVFVIVVLDMARKASNQLMLFECFHSESSASSSRVQPNCSIRSRSASPEPSAGSHVSSTVGSVQVNRSIGESLYDEIVPDSPVSLAPNRGIVRPVRIMKGLLTNYCCPVVVALPVILQKM